MQWADPGVKSQKSPVGDPSDRPVRPRPLARVVPRVDRAARTVPPAVCTQVSCAIVCACEVCVCVSHLYTPMHIKKLPLCRVLWFVLNKLLSQKKKSRVCCVRCVRGPKLYEVRWLYALSPGLAPPYPWWRRGEIKTLLTHNQGSLVAYPGTLDNSPSTSARPPQHLALFRSARAQLRVTRPRPFQPCRRRAQPSSPPGIPPRPCHAPPARRRSWHAAS